MERKSRRKSALWQFFTPVDDNKAMCEVCKKIVSYKTSITNLKSHLSHNHQTVILVPPAWKSLDIKDEKPCTSKVVMPALNLKQVELKQIVEWTEEKQDSPLTVVVNPKIPQKSSQTPANNHKNVVTVNTDMLFCPKNKNIDCAPANSHKNAVIVNTDMSFYPKNKNIDCALMKLFINDFHPYDLVDSFKEFVRELNPKYELPSQEVISERYIPDLYEKCLFNAKELAKHIKKVCLTTDHWTDQNGDNLFAVTGHFIDEGFNLRSILLECSLIHEDLGKSIKRIVQEWNLEKKIVLAVSSNKDIIVDALKKELKVKHFGCFAETLNLAVGNALNIVSISNLINKLRSIADYFKVNIQENQELLSFQKSHGITSIKKLKTDSPKQWHTTYYMLLRFVELEVAVRVIDTNLPHIEEQEWLVMKELIKVLKPFEAITKIINEGNYKVASYIIVITNGLIEGCNEMQNVDISGDVKLFVENLSEEFSSRLGNLECSEILGITTYLDPRFKSFAFQDKEVEIWVRDNITNLLNQLKGNATDKVTKTNQEGDTLFKFFDQHVRLLKPTNPQNKQGIIELQRYVEEDLLPRDENPLEWWRNNRFKYPLLSQIAAEYLCVVGMPILDKELYSKERMLRFERLMRLPSKTAQQLISLHVNSKLLSECYWL